MPKDETPIKKSPPIPTRTRWDCTVLLFVPQSSGTNRPGDFLADLDDEVLLLSFLDQQIFVLQQLKIQRSIGVRNFRLVDAQASSLDHFRYFPFRSKNSSFLFRH